MGLLKHPKEGKGTLGAPVLSEAGPSRGAQLSLSICVCVGAELW